MTVVKAGAAGMPTSRSASTVRETVTDLVQQLAAAGVPTPENDAELLVRHVLGWSRAELLIRGGEPLASEAVVRLGALGARRAAREPLQFIVGSVGFRHLDLLVRPGVFIPRPETEVLAGEAIARVPPGGVVVESCTGIGAVACAVATEASPRLVVATDCSPAAVALARENAVRTGSCTVQVRCGDLLDPVPADLRGVVDVLVSNPPYLTAAELSAAEPEVHDWDPPEALVAGPDGTEAAVRLIAAASQWLRPRGWLLVEVDPARAVATADLAKAAGLTEVTVVPDLAGRLRIVAATRPRRRVP
ncbi:MAG: peptide chain release factor N(5)-glutamine methyltransferase [Egibacteraceae bacterium]